MKTTHIYRNSNPVGYDSDCAICGGKKRDAIHERRWYLSSTGNHQGVVVGEIDNIAVTYDKADAPLVAEAPALLDSVTELSDWMREHAGPKDDAHEMLIRAMSAIQKATGEA